MQILKKEEKGNKITYNEKVFGKKTVGKF